MGHFHSTATRSEVHRIASNFRSEGKMRKWLEEHDALAGYPKKPTWKLTCWLPTEQISTLLKDRMDKADPRRTSTSPAPAPAPAPTKAKSEGAAASPHEKKSKKKKGKGKGKKKMTKRIEPATGRGLQM